EALQGLDLSAGRFIADADTIGSATVVVLGREVAGALGGLQPSDRVSVSGRPFQVIGITEAGKRLMGPGREDSVFIPASTAESMYRTAQGSLAFMVQVSASRPVPDAVSDIRSVLRQSRRLAGDEPD